MKLRELTNESVGFKIIIKFIEPRLIAAAACSRFNEESEHNSTILDSSCILILCELLVDMDL